MPHARLLVLLLVASAFAPQPAAARDASAGVCELAPAIQALGRLAATAGIAPAGATLALTATPVSVTIATTGTTREAAPLLTIACDDATVSAQEGKHVRGAGWSVARGRHATSLDFAPGALFREAVHVLVLDDGGLSVSLGDPAAPPDRPRPASLMYARELRPTGELVEREGPRVGCGCERVTGSDGRRVERPLPAAR